MPAKRTFLYCRPGGHVVGEIVYSEYLASRVIALWWYAQSLSAEPMSRPKRGMTIIGDVPHVLCTLCRCTASWYMGHAAVDAKFAQLMSRYLGKVEG